MAGTYTSHMKTLPYVKRALTNSKYYPSYVFYGGTLFLTAIYICDWKWVGRHIPIWRSYRLDITDE